MYNIQVKEALTICIWLKYDTSRSKSFWTAHWSYVLLIFNHKHNRKIILDMKLIFFKTKVNLFNVSRLKGVKKKAKQYIRFYLRSLSDLSTEHSSWSSQDQKMPLGCVTRSPASTMAFIRTTPQYSTRLSSTKWVCFCTSGWGYIFIMLETHIVVMSLRTYFVSEINFPNILQSLLQVILIHTIKFWCVRNIILLRVFTLYFLLIGSGSTAHHTESWCGLQGQQGGATRHLFPAPGPRQHWLYHTEHTGVLAEQPHKTGWDQVWWLWVLRGRGLLGPLLRLCQVNAWNHLHFYKKCNCLEGFFYNHAAAQCSVISYT